MTHFKRAGAEYFASAAVYDESRAAQVSKALMPLLKTRDAFLAMQVELGPALAAGRRLTARMSSSKCSGTRAK